jgi:hypothetical protein
VLSRRRLTILVAAAMMMVAMLAVASPAFATHCVNVHKPQGAGTQGFEHNGGRAGFVDISTVFPGAPQVDVFVHPSASQEIPGLGAPGQFNGAAQGGSLPEGAHDSEGWTEL